MIPNLPEFQNVTTHLEAALREPDLKVARVQVQAFHQTPALSAVISWCGKVLQSAGSVQRRRICQMLGWLETVAPEISTLLLSAVRDPSWPVREAAAQALASQGAVVCPALVETVLEEKEPLVRVAIAHTLVTVDPTGASQALASAAQDRSVNRRRRALEALGYFANQFNAVQTLLQALEDSHLKLRAAAARALGQLEALALPALPRLVRCCHDQAPRVRQAAVQAAQVVGKHAPQLQPWLPVLLGSGSPQMVVTNLLAHPDLPETMRTDLTLRRCEKQSGRRERQGTLRVVVEMVQRLLEQKV